MTNLKYLFFLLVFFLINYFTIAQPYEQRINAVEKHLINPHHQRSHTEANENNFSASKSNARIETSNFYPAKATNYTWNTANSVWEIFDTTLYTYIWPGLTSSVTRKDSANNFLTRVLSSYDALNFQIDAIHQYWSGGWQNDYRDTSSYDSHGNIILQLHQIWNASQWITVSSGGYQYLNTYDISGNILIHVTQSWDSLAAGWNNINRDTNTYNVNDQIVQKIRQSWITSVWNNTSKSNYSYDVSNVNTQTVDYWWSGSTWTNNAQIINPVWAVWTGDIATSKYQSYTYQTWSGSAWVNAERLLSATYDTYGGSIETFQQYISGSWVNENRYSIFYYMQYNKTGKRDETWNIPTTSWDTAYEYKYIFTYDVNNSITQSIYQEYSGTSHSYLNRFKTVYSDFLFLSLPEIDPEANFSAIIYPNPMTEYADVIIHSENFMPVLYQAYDIKGKLVFSEKSKSKNIRLYKNNFTPGIYLLLISDPSGEISSLKFIVQ